MSSVFSCLTLASTTIAIVRRGGYSAHHLHPRIWRPPIPSVGPRTNSVLRPRRHLASHPALSDSGTAISHDSLEALALSRVQSLLGRLQTGIFPTARDQGSGRLEQALGSQDWSLDVAERDSAAH